MRILYYGTPEFAVPSLKILLDYGYEIGAVVTMPDKPGGRLGTIESAVKKYAVSQDLRVLQPEKLKNPAFIEEIQGIQPDLQIVVAFRMLPEIVWNMPPKGTMNLHGSLLPQYRGAAPINWAIINGETETGCTTFLLKHAIDTGDLLFQSRMPIGENETAGEVHDRMMQLGADLVLRSVQAIDLGTAKPFPQDDIIATHAPKINQETCKLDFDRPASAIHNQIRGLSPHPGAWTTLDGKLLKIYRTALVRDLAVKEPPGTFISDGKTQLLVAAQDAYLSITDLQLEGKKRMGIRDFLNGFAIG